MRGGGWKLERAHSSDFRRQPENGEEQGMGGGRGAGRAETQIKIKNCERETFRVKVILQ